MLWIVKSPFITPVTLTDVCMYHIRLSSHCIVCYSRDTDGPTAGPTYYTYMIAAPYLPSMWGSPQLISLGMLGFYHSICSTYIYIKKLKLTHEVTIHTVCMGLSTRLLASPTKACHTYMQNCALELTSSTHHFYSFKCLASASEHKTQSSNAVHWSNLPKCDYNL